MFWTTSTTMMMMSNDDGDDDDDDDDVYGGVAFAQLSIGRRCSRLCRVRW
jgi:hypothetical protein